jgi:hypothetical protein
MKYFFYFALTVTSLLTKAQRISGRILDLATNKPLPNATAYLLDTTSAIDSAITERDNYYFEGAWGYKILNKINVDSNGFFTFQVTSSKSYTLCVSHRMPYVRYGVTGLDSAFSYRQDFVHKINLKNQIKFYKVFRLMVTCPYYKTKNQAFCPKCKKKDRVKEILFGLPIFREDEHYYDKYYLGGCMVDGYCNPAKHCLRCNLDFRV